MRIYVTDDEPLILKHMERVLRRVVPEAEIRTFEESPQLLAAAQESLPDVVFLDVEMPGINGIDLARSLKQLKPNLNLIFVTGFDEYVKDAMAMFASGYVVKPAGEAAIREQLENLRYPVERLPRILVQTFGNFSVLREGLPVRFRYQKSRELLAYLVDRRGAGVTRKELATVLFEESSFSRKEQKMLSRFIEELEKDLKAEGIEGIYSREDGILSVQPTRFTCDLYEYLLGRKNLYRGEYMEEYSWGEYFKGTQL